MNEVDIVKSYITENLTEEEKKTMIFYINSQHCLFQMCGSLIIFT